MQVIIQPLYDGCLLSVTTSGTFGDSWTPTIGLRTGCRLKATYLDSSLMGCTATGDPCSRCSLAGPAAARVRLCMQMTSAFWQAAQSICKHYWTCWLCDVHSCTWRSVSPRPKLWWCPLWCNCVISPHAHATAVTFDKCATSAASSRGVSTAKACLSCSAMTQSVQIDAIPKHPYSCYTSLV